MDDSQDAGGINLQEREDTEHLQKITDILLAAGYFRARLNNIEPFDKVLGGCCWCITGLMYSVEMDFRDDLTLGEKIRLSEKITESLGEMRCPYQLFPHQIQGLNYEKIIPVLKWLIEQLMKTRDTRGAITRKQALQSFSRKYNRNVKREKHEHIEKMLDLVEQTNPKRVYKSSKIYTMKLEDPKRVHSCLREFNDLSASRLYKHIFETIARMVRYEERDRLKAEQEEGLGNLEEVKNTGVKQDSIAKTIKQIKRDKEAGGLDEKQEFLDLNDAILGVKGDETEKGELDEEISRLRQKTLRVKADNVNQILSQNIEALTEDVKNLQQMSEAQLTQDEEFFIKSEQENHERNLQAIKKRKEKLEQELTEESEHYKTTETLIKEESKKLDDNSVLKSKLERDITTLDTKIAQSPITESQLAKIHKKEELKQQIKDMKKKCKEEKVRLDEELIRIKKKNEELEKEEQARVLATIEAKYNEQYEKLMDQKKKIAEQNRSITALQRKIENCPSKIELSQYHKRFTELFETINAKFEENRKYSNLFNTKNEVKELLNHQINYINEIRKEFTNAKGKKERKVLQDNLESVNAELATKIATSELTLKEIRNEKDMIVEEFNKCLNMEKEHYNRVKLLEAECDKNELLMKQVKEIKKEQKRQQEATA